MAVTADFVVERQEVETVLSSGIFDRAPSLEQLFAYITSKYLEGSGDYLKEYNIAVEAFGRTPEFDQKRDSIVRVQAHRLRERLAEYYQKEGADHPVHIVIPHGQYTPRFLSKTHDLIPASPLEKNSAPDEVILPAITPAPSLPKWGPYLMVGVFLSILALAIFIIPGHTAAGNSISAKAIPLSPAANSNSIRILAGLKDENYIDASGRIWQKDQFYDGGSPFSVPDHLIFGTREQRLYRSGREGLFKYDIPLAAGVYELRLYFAETTFGETNSTGFGGESTRVFDVLINGKPALKRLDVVSEAGASVADIKTFKDVSPAADGKLHLSFSAEAYNPFLNAIEITPGIPGRMQPIRMVAQTHGYFDKAGQYWEPDRYGIGGQLVKPSTEATDVPDPGLYSGGRFGNLTYVIPVSPGRYGLKLYMTERRESKSSGGRQFDILFNGIALERKFSILKRAGDPNRGIVVSYNGLEPNYQGKLVLSLVPNPDFAVINALEVVDQSR